MGGEGRTGWEVKGGGRGEEGREGKVREGKGREGEALGPVPYR